MLHILLLILKVIGIILAVILGILVLLVCIAVFVPVRYEVSGRCGGTLSTLKVKGRVTWLCSLVRADIYYKENKLKWRLRIAWKKISAGKESGADVRTDERLPGDTGTQIKKTKGEEEYEEIWSNESDEGGEEKEEYEKAQKGDEEIWPDGEKAEEKHGEDEKAYQKIQKSMEEECPGDEESGRKERRDDEERSRKKRKDRKERSRKKRKDDKKRSREEREDHKERDREDGGRIKGFVRKIKELYGRIKCTIHNICDKIKKLLEKKNKILGFIRDETHVGAFRKAKKEVSKLFKRLRPKKFLLEVEFGFDDPSWTGRTLAVIAPFYPFFGGVVSLKPDFTEKKLTGRLYAKGGIRFCHFVIMAGNLFFSRNVRRTYRDIRNFEI